MTMTHAYPHLQDGQIDLFKNIQRQGKLPHYSHLMYDKYRKIFYRFALMPDDNIKRSPAIRIKVSPLSFQTKTMKLSVKQNFPATLCPSLVHRE